MGTAAIIGAGSNGNNLALVNNSGALHVFLDGGSLTVGGGGGGGATGSMSLFDKSGIDLYFDNRRVPISGVSMPAITGSVAITSSAGLTGSFAITSSAVLSILGSVALSPYTAWTGIGSVLVSNNPVITGSVAITSSIAIAQTGSVAITSSSILPISGNSVSLILSTGSMIPKSYSSGVWAFTNTIVNVRSWSVSISGGLTAFDLSPGSFESMVYHSIPQTIALYASDTSPSVIAVRTATNISGTIEMWTA